MRVVIEVEVDLDPLPGVFHTPESAAETIEYFISDRIPHYHPTVRVQIPAQRTASA